MKAIVKNYNSLVKKYQEIEKDSTEKEIHDKRVILRRIFPILAACKINPGKVKNGEEAFKLFGKLRDIQVQILKLEASEQNYEINQYLLHLKELESELQLKVQKFCKKKQVEFPSIKKTKLKKTKLNKKAERSLKKLIARAEKQSIEDADDIHRIRIEFKKFRYLVEILSYIETIDEEKLEKMKVYQDILGEIQDYEVLIQGIKNFYKKRNQNKTVEPGENESDQIIRIFNEEVDIDAIESAQNILIENFDNELINFIEICREVLVIKNDPKIDEEIEPSTEVEIISIDETSQAPTIETILAGETKGPENDEVNSSKNTDNMGDAEIILTDKSEQTNLAEASLPDSIDEVIKDEDTSTKAENIDSPEITPQKKAPAAKRKRVNSKTKTAGLDYEELK